MVVLIVIGLLMGVLVWYFVVCFLFDYGVIYFVLGIVQLVEIVCIIEDVLYIFGSLDCDVFFVLGMVYVQDWLFQMNVLCCVVQGWLVEIYGFGVVGVDDLVCRLGFYCNVCVLFEVQMLDIMQVLCVYVDGVNVWIYQVNFGVCGCGVLELFLFFDDILYWEFVDLLVILKLLVVSLIVQLCCEVLCVCLLLIVLQCGQDLLVVLNELFLFGYVVMFFGDQFIGVEWCGVQFDWVSQFVGYLVLLLGVLVNGWVVVVQCMVVGGVLLVNDL